MQHCHFKRLKLYGYGYGDKSAFRHDFCKEGEKLTFEELTQASDDVIQRISKIKGIKTVGAMAGGDSTMNLMGGGNDSVSMYILLDEDSKVKASDVEEKIVSRTKDLDCKVETNVLPWITAVISAAVFPSELRK